jgi:signal transduction histidine kinase/ligand-binding sensor domain-containing protein/CheY-like chemotaxis protein
MRFVTFCVAVSLLGTSTLGWTLPLDTMRFKRLLYGSVESDEVINAVHVTRQDPNGFIWFGGEHGLARYDGHEIKIYQHDDKDPNSLTSNAIWDIVFDHKGIMWLATDSGLGRYNAASDSFTSFHAKGWNTESISSDSVRSLAVDKDNNLLIGTDNGFNILDPSRKNYRTYSEREDDPFRLPDGSIHAIHAEENGIIWLGTVSAGLLRLQLAPFSVEVFEHQPLEPSSLGNNRITDILRDHTGALWVSTFGGGVSRMNTDGKSFTNYTHDPKVPKSIGSNTIWDLFEDSDKNVWVATDHGGLALYDRAHDNFNHLRHNPYDDLSLSSDNIRSVFEDKHGDLWIGTFPIGTNFFDRSSGAFDNHSHISGVADSLSHSTILTIVPSREGHLWIGTEGGINSFDPITKKSTAIVAQPGVSGALQSNAVLTIAEQDNGDLWVGTWSGGLHRRDAKTGAFEHFMPSQDHANTVNSSYIWDLLIDRNNQLWIGTETGGVNRYDLTNGKFKRYLAADPALPENVSNAHIWTIIEDSSGVIWLGSLHGLNRYNSATDTFTHYFREPGNPNSLTSNRIVALFEDSNKNLWIGTQGGGINILDANRKTFHHLSLEDGLPSANIASIIEANDGEIWATTDKGVARIDPDTKAIKIYQKSYGLIGNNFNRDASYVDKNGLLYLGSTDGLSIFDSSKIHAKNITPNITLTDFKIFNTSITSATKNSPLTDPIQNTQAIVLNYDQRFFSIGFSALSYRSANRNQYAYKLDGFDKDWNNVGNRHLASYTNIGPGRYTFRVRAANATGQWSEQDTTLEITVRPPLWLTWWAYGIYLAIFMALMWAYSRHKAKKIELQKERDVIAKLLKLDKIKDAFLANTSHELRTPLNGIIGLAESLSESCEETLDPAKINQLKMIVSSGKRLSHLINDILDLSKLADRQIELKMVPVNLRQLTDTVITLITPLVGEKSIKLQNEIPGDIFAVLADENRLHQIMFNLIGNAIKYSDQGFVKINAQQDSHFTTIRVKDSGIGISQEDLGAIFHSFVQLEHSDAREHGGTGLGLAITKQLIELHGGQITVNSQLGKGTVFIFTIPTSTQKCERKKASAEIIPKPVRFKDRGTINHAVHHTDLVAETDLIPHTNLIHNTDRAQQATIEKDTPLTDQKGERTTERKRSVKNGTELTANNIHPMDERHFKIAPLDNAEKITILSVDDDPINRMVLTGILKLHHYKIIEADNGLSALEKIQAHPEIDLVILDIMMPKMTGYEACEILRKTHSLCELPVIFLTAKDIENELTQGFISGGNDFVSKPVKREELLARVKVQLMLLLNARSLRVTDTTLAQFKSS